MKKKFLLPMMAFVFAIGLSFATERSSADPINDYILVDPIAETFMAIPEVNCGVPEDDCRVKFVEGGDEHFVYDTPNTDTLKEGSSRAHELWKNQN